MRVLSIYYGHDGPINRYISTVLLLNSGLRVDLMANPFVHKSKLRYSFVLSCFAFGSETKQPLSQNLKIKNKKLTKLV